MPGRSGSTCSTPLFHRAAPEPEPSNQSTLTDEIGRRVATQVAYCRPDPAGEIELASGRYALSPEPSTNVYLKFVFMFEEAATETVRELGVFLGTQTRPGLPAGQRYFSPDELVARGRLYCLERVSAFPRNGATRQMFEYVLPF